MASGTSPVPRKVAVGGSAGAQAVIADPTTVKLGDYQSYYRAVRNDFVASLASSPLSTHPDPVEHCTICSWLPRCMGQRRDDRHLTFVAGIREDQIRKLAADGVATVD